MTKPRTPIPDDISAEVMFQHDRTCCICHHRELAVQIHHIDEDPTNHTVENLAVLCLEHHHEQTQVRGGFAKKLKAADVVRSRNDWTRRVRDRRNKIDEGGAAVYANMFGREWREPAALFLPFLDAVFRQPVPLSRYLAGRLPGADSHFAVRIHC
jgi:hypothetical protein